MKYLISVAALALSVSAYAQSQQMSPGQAFLQTFDADRNGQVSRDEFVKPQVQNIEKQFDYMDKNRDGAVDPGEADAFASEMQKKMQQMRSQGENR